MSGLFFLIPITLLLLVIAILGFFWAVKHEQFDDLDNPSYQILYDDKSEKKP